jgi:hypothetical protein
MEPKYFKLAVWDKSSSAECLDGHFGSSGYLPADYIGPILFRINPNLRTWADVIFTRKGVLLFSEKTKRAFEVDKIRGIYFCPAEIEDFEVGRLRNKPQPNYFWGRASGVIDVDLKNFNEHDRRIPVRVIPETGVDVFHLRTPKGVGLYAFNRQVVEALRKHNIENIEVTPLDYYRMTERPIKPPYRIDLQAKQWPPSAWYPKGFVPHPNNLL